MRNDTRTAAALVVAGLCAVAVSGCSSSGGGSSPSKSAAGMESAAPASPAAARTSASASMGKTVDSRSGSLGKILVNDKGRTLYLFKADKPKKSTCTGACAEAWPPLTVTGKPTAGSGVESNLLGTITRSDGSKQVTYKDQPLLYLYKGDHAAGDTNGQGLSAFGAKWYVLDPTGKEVTRMATSSPSMSSSPSKSSSSGGY